MKSLLPLVAAFIFAASPATIALTSEQDIPPECVRSDARELSGKVAKAKNGLIALMIGFRLHEPLYVVAHLAVRSDDPAEPFKTPSNN